MVQRSGFPHTALIALSSQALRALSSEADSTLIHWLLLGGVLSSQRYCANALLLALSGPSRLTALILSLNIKVDGSSDGISDGWLCERKETLVR